MNAADSKKIRDLVGEAGATIARCWPLSTFVYRNPLQGFEQLPFEEAVLRGERLFGGRGYLTNTTYRALAQVGRIREEAIRAAVMRSGLLDGYASAIRIGPACVEPFEILHLHLLHGLNGIDDALFHWMMAEGRVLQEYRRDVPAAVRKEPAAEHLTTLWAALLDAMGRAVPRDSGARPIAPMPPSPKEGRPGRLLRDVAKVGRSRTTAGWLQAVTGDDLTDAINDQMIRWCSGFLDEGMAVWTMPDRERGFFRAWRDLAPRDPALRLLGIADAPRKIDRLPDVPERAIVEGLTRLGLPERVWPDYLSLHLAQLPGWAGLIRWHEAESMSGVKQRHPIDLTQYLAIRLFYEAELVEAVCRKRWGIPGTMDRIQAHLRKGSEPSAAPEEPANGGPRRLESQDAWRLFHLAQFLGLAPQAIRFDDGTALYRVIELLDHFPPERHGPVWLDALELSHRDRWVRLLRENNSGGREGEAPSVQAVFCIDARSELLRRHLEKLGSFETFGFAGFFGVPIRYRPYDAPEGSGAEQLLCPALITPDRVVVERPRFDQEEAAREREARSGWHRMGHGLFHELKGNNLTAYMMIDLLSALFGLSFIARTLFPRAYQHFRRAVDRRFHPPVATVPAIDPPARAAVESGTAWFGFTSAEQTGFVEKGLRMMGLTERFARIVLLCAHGSASENNPYAAAYDCGACGGRPGGPNARVLAAMANKAEIRSALRNRGIEIPGETLFLAAEHNTATDRVVIFDADRIPAGRRKEVSQLAAALDEAGRRVATERIARLPGGPAAAAPEPAARHAERRSLDWSQVRPEWGLSGNAAFLIGRRSLSRGLDLEGRVFMHSYDPRPDETGAVLEAIMTAPLLVVQWIGMEYYFSSVDPWIYGSGSKAIHNVVGGVGVMLGRQSDLRPGLPLQSVMDGRLPYHEPVRPLIIIEAPAERVGRIIGAHHVLQRLFNHRWLRLMVVEPSGSVWREYRPGGEWMEIEAAAERAA
jgi:uncharacterized protein